MVGFDDDELTGRNLWRVLKKRNMRNVTILRVDGRSRSRRKENMFRAGLLVLVPALLAAAVGAVFFGVRALGEALFARNSRFTITTIAITPGVVVSADLVRDYLQVREGANLFAVDVRAKRRDLLAKVPNVQALSISRELPGTLRVAVTERLPVARLAGAGDRMAVDREGMQFVIGPRGAADLPVITGHPAKGIQAGARVSGAAVAALDLLRECASPELGVTVKQIDISSDERLTVALIYDNVPRSVQLAWWGMGQRSPVARQKLGARLDELVQAMQPGGARVLTQFDATLDGEIVAR